MAEAKLSKKAFKVLESLDTITKIPEGDIKPMVGQPGIYRLRVGAWRILFSYIDDTKLNVLVGQVSPSGGAYKGA